MNPSVCGVQYTAEVHLTWFQVVSLPLWPTVPGWGAPKEHAEMRLVQIHTWCWSDQQNHSEWTVPPLDTELEVWWWGKTFITSAMNVEDFFKLAFLQQLVWMSNFYWSEQIHWSHVTRGDAALQYPHFMVLGYSECCILYSHVIVSPVLSQLIYISVFVFLPLHAVLCDVEMLSSEKEEMLSAGHTRNCTVILDSSITWWGHLHQVFTRHLAIDTAGQREMRNDMENVQGEHGEF